MRLWRSSEQQRIYFGSYIFPLGLAISLVGCGNLSSPGNLKATGTTSTSGNTSQDLTITPANPNVRAGATLQFATSTTGGTWAVAGGSANGTISIGGLYSAPSSPPASNVGVTYSAAGSSGQTNVTVLNPVPVLSALSPSTLTSSGTVVLFGSGFLPGSQVLVNGVVVPTQFQDSSHLNVNVTVSAGAGSSLGIQVANPAPGPSSSATVALIIGSQAMVITPASLAGGDVSVSVTLPGVTQGSVVMLNGAPLSTTSVANDVITATGYLPPWISGSVPISVTGADGTTVLGEGVEPITPTSVPFDTAARFATQAAWGPRPDVVLHIQQVGLEAFLNEQFQQPVGSYNLATTSPIRSFLLNVIGGNSLLRLRVAWAFQTFMPSQTYYDNHNLSLPWEQTLERDAFTNYRQILLDAASDPNLASLLDLPGNVAPTDPSVHPNQNFARESMQLFSLGTVMLNDDGSTQTGANGQPVPAYGEDTVLDMSRVYTGWNYGPPVNPSVTVAGIDFSAPLVATESQHDHGAKLLFGTVQVPPGQTAEQDRDAALDAIMNHPNTAPFVSRLLIQRLVKSQPSPAYIKRIASVFNDNGAGVKGDLTAVIRAILLDPEARAGDLQASPSDGFLQDPVYAQTFMMSLFAITSEDDQPTGLPADLGESMWDSGTVFSYFSPSYVVPGTQINSPEFQLVNNFTLTQRTQLLWSVASLQQPGFNNGFGGWLYGTFTTLPTMIDALNHLLYHGTMPESEQTAIFNACSSISDPQRQLESAVFLALNSDAYTVIQ